MFDLSNSNIVENNFYLAIPILKPYPVEGIDENLQDKILKEVENLKGTYFVDDVKIEYQTVKDMDSLECITQKLSPKRYGNSRIFIFQMIISNAESLLKPYDKWSAQENFVITVLSYLDIFAYSIAYALGIYCDGIFDVDDFIAYFNDGNYEKEGGVLNSFPHIHEDDESLYMPSSDISLQDTLNWFLSIDDIINACGKTALGKSLSIYSRMFSSFSVDDDVFMSGLLSVMALEALYESNGSKKVLGEKIVSFLNVDKQKCEKDIKKYMIIDALLLMVVLNFRLSLALMMGAKILKNHMIKHLLRLNWVCAKWLWKGSDNGSNIDDSYKTVRKRFVHDAPMQYSLIPSLNYCSENISFSGEYSFFGDKYVNIRMMEGI